MRQGICNGIRGLVVYNNPIVEITYQSYIEKHIKMEVLDFLGQMYPKVFLNLIVSCDNYFD